MRTGFKLFSRGKFLSVFISLLIVSLLSIRAAEARQLIKISGVVLDEETQKPLPYASVFLNNSTYGAIADTEGRFEFSAKPGNYDLIVNFFSYQPIIYPINISVNDPVNYTFKLRPLEYDLKEISVESSRDEIWYRNYETFKKSFIGTSQNAAECQILNPEVLIIDYNARTRVMKVWARDVLKIENKALGYDIEYLLDAYEYDVGEGRLYFQGFPKYVKKTGGKRRTRKWEKEREKAYYGSPDHFFSSVMAGTAEEEGFSMIEIIKRKNPDRPSETEIAAARKKVRANRASGFKVDRESPEMKVILKARRPEFITTTNNQPYPQDSLIVKQGDKLFLDFPEIIQIAYAREKPDVNYTGSRMPSDKQVSRITLTGGPTEMLPNGSIADPRGILFEGYMGWQKLADMVPLDYSLPVKAK